jgi:acetylglutamate kinase
MYAKLESAISGLNQGVSEIQIGSGAVEGILEKLIGKDQYGTRMVSEK